MDMKEKLVALFRECLHFDHNEFSDDMSLNVDLTVENLIAHGVRLESEQATSDKASEWISVKERMPEIGELVLTALDDGFVDSNYLEGNNTWGFEHDSPITHWMPQPQPPKGEQP